MKRSLPLVTDRRWPRCTFLSSGVVLWLAGCGASTATSDAATAVDGAQGPIDAAEPPSALAIPGDLFFPEGIAAAADGTLYVGSLALGEIARVPPEHDRVIPFASAPAESPRAAGGVRVVTARSALAVCCSDFAGGPAALRTIALADGAPLGTYSLGEGTLCNDVTVDGSGNVYASDSFGDRIFRLAAGGETAEVWSADPSFAAEGYTIALNGIAWDGAAAIYAVRYDTGALQRVPIGRDGAAGAATEIAVTPPLALPDGITRVDASTYLVVEGTGQLCRVTIAGATASKEVIATGLDEPTTAAVVGDDAWVVESQVSALLANPKMPTPTLPFQLRRVPLR